MMTYYKDLDDLVEEAMKCSGVAFEHYATKLEEFVAQVAEEHSERVFLPSSLPPSVQSAFKMGALAWPLALQRAIDAGITNSGKLANILFFMHHPERKGRSISKSEINFQELVDEWKAWRHFAKIQLDFGAVQVKPGASVGGGASSNTTCKVAGKSVTCGDCVIVEKRAHTELPSDTIAIRLELRYNKKNNLKLRPEVEAAWSQLVASARADGISAPYLKVRSAFRSYSRQSRLWRNRLTGIFRKMGCTEPVLSCIFNSADRTNKALKNLGIPHPKSAWIKRFRYELASVNCRPNCPEGGSDSVQKAVSRLAKWTARPGRSKHHSGRAIDVYLGSKNEKGNVSKQRRTEAFRWLVCNAAHFGFSNYIVEPWHWEYTRN